MMKNSPAELQSLLTPALVNLRHNGPYRNAAVTAAMLRNYLRQEVIRNMSCPSKDLRWSVLWVVQTGAIHIKATYGQSRVQSVIDGNSYSRPFVS